MKVLCASLVVCMMACGGSEKKAVEEVKPAAFRLMTLDPGHFHAALVQKFMYPGLDPVVHVYAPDTDDVKEHLKRIDSFNFRTEATTSWQEKVYTGADYLEKMLSEKPGNVVVISGNNAKKTDYILRSIEAGLNVLADKPMVILPADMEKLKKAFEVAAAKKVLLYDIMTERFEITTMLQRALSRSAEFFGELEKGTPQQPAITKESVHHFSKIVAGAPLKRPMWFYDVRQEGEGIVDVTTHLVDLIQWEAFPDMILNAQDVSMLSARRWATPITKAQFSKTTGATDFPEYLKQDVKGGVFQSFSNGEMVYTLKGVHAKVSVKWNFEAPAGTGDTHYSMMRGTRARLIIEKGKLRVEKVGDVADADFEAKLKAALVDYSDVEIKKEGAAWVLVVPEKYNVGHEDHFGEVTTNYLKYLREGKLPDWEVPNMIVKYATIMKAYEKSR
jgi:predicted dehydrogenase